MKRSISIINTGIQLVNVIEAIHQFGCKDNYLIIGQFNLFPDRIKQIEKMLEDDFMNHHFKKIYTLPKQFSPQNPLRFAGYLMSYIKFIFILLFSRKFDYCFSGVYTDIIQRPVNFLAYYKNRQIQLCLVDEGLRVMEDAKMRLEQFVNIKKQKQRKTLFLRDLYLSIFKRWFPPALCYFSVYDLPVQGDDYVVVNHYSYFKTQNIYRFSFSKNAIVIVGQPYAELKMISKERYQEIFQGIMDIYGENPKYYVPHPMEVYYSSWISTSIEIIKSQYPVELLLLGSEIKALVGLNSSVLYNAARMNICNNIISYRIPQDDYLEKYNQEAAERQFSSFRENGIEIRTVPMHETKLNQL